MAIANFGCFSYMTDEAQFEPSSEVFVSAEVGGGLLPGLILSNEPSLSGHLYVVDREVGDITILNLRERLQLPSPIREAFIFLTGYLAEDLVDFIGVKVELAMEEIDGSWLRQTLLGSAENGPQVTISITFRDAVWMLCGTVEPLKHVSLSGQQTLLVVLLPLLDLRLRQWSGHARPVSRAIARLLLVHSDHCSIHR